MIKSIAVAILTTLSLGGSFSSAFMAPRPALVPSACSSTRRFSSRSPRRDASASSRTAAAPQPFLLWLRGQLPPTPEDELILYGDVGSMFTYALTSHTLHAYIVESVIRTSDSLRDAAQALDPAQEVVTLQVPVWLDQPHLAGQIVGSNMQTALMNHWGPLFSSVGVSAVALSSCWLLAGYWHRAFLFDNTLACDTGRVLQKTVETWITTAVMLTGLTVVSNELVHHVPLLQAWLGCASCREFLFTKADAYYIVDSLTVLLLWRFMISTLLGYGKK